MLINISIEETVVNPQTSVLVNFSKFSLQRALLKMENIYVYICNSS